MWNMTSFKRAPLAALSIVYYLYYLLRIQTLVSSKFLTLSGDNNVSNYDPSCILKIGKAFSRLCSILGAFQLCVFCMTIVN